MEPCGILASLMLVNGEKGGLVMCHPEDISATPFAYEVKNILDIEKTDYHENFLLS